MGDIDRAYYRSKAEEQEWAADRDPLKTLAAWLTNQGLTDQSVLDAIRAEVKLEIEAGVKFALEAPYPAVSEVDEDVYA